jgi:hypothetical protein
MKTIKQINNLKIRWNTFYKKYQVFIGKRVLEEFSALPHAMVFCQETKDFIKYSPRDFNIFPEEKESKRE